VLALLSFVPILSVLAYIGAPTRRLRLVVVSLFAVGLAGVAIYMRGHGWECSPDCPASIDIAWVAAYYGGIVLFFLDWYVIVRLFLEVAQSVRQSGR
jgi:hypothetical protein